jgi:hypothetical protein
MNDMRNITGAVAIALLVLAGCGGGVEDQPEMGRVTGTVTLDGDPLPNAHIAFAPLGDEGGTSTATANEDGYYELNYKRDIKGAVVGKHNVRVWTVADEGDSIDEATGRPIPKPEEVVPARYNEESTYEKEVEPGEQTIDLELTTG